MDKKSGILSQVVMTFILAAAMSGVMGLVVMGPSMQWLARWPKQFLVAWPIAFALTMVAWRAAGCLPGQVARLCRSLVAANPAARLRCRRDCWQRNVVELRFNV